MSWYIVVGDGMQLLRWLVCTCTRRKGELAKAWDHFQPQYTW